jgi:hypothetical protein
VRIFFTQGYLAVALQSFLVALVGQSSKSRERSLMRIAVPRRRLTDHRRDALLHIVVGAGFGSGNVASVTIVVAYDCRRTSPLQASHSFDQHDLQNK